MSSQDQGIERANQLSFVQLLGQNDCPRYDQIEEEVNESEEVKKMNQYYEVHFPYRQPFETNLLFLQPFFQKLEQWTGLTNITIYNAWDVADTIFVEVMNRRSHGVR